MSTPTPDLPPVSVIGLGAMGQALAHAFLTAGHPTTVWNRTPGRADGLAARGAVVARTPAEAVAASPLTILVVLHREAVEVVLDTVGSDLADHTIVNLVSSTPEDARAIAARVTGQGASYLDGKIMVPTPLIGTEGSFLLYSGDSAVFAEHQATLRALGGEATLLGTDPGLAALHDLAMLDIFFNGMTAFLHATALVGADGVPASAFVGYAERIVDVLRATLAGLAADIDNGKYPGDEDNLDMELAALDHIVEASRTRGLTTSVPELPRTLVHAAVDQGHGRDGFSRVVELLRSDQLPVLR